MKKLLSIRSGCRYRNISYHTLHIDNFGSAPPKNKYINVEHMRLIFVRLCVYEMRGNHIETRGMQRNSQKRRICLWPPPPQHLSQNLKWTRKGRQGAPFQFKTWEFPKKTVFEIWIKVLPGKTMVSSASLLTMHCNGTHPDEKQQENKTQKDFKALSKIYVKGSTWYATSGQNSTRPLRWIGNRGKTANKCQVGSLFQICICFLL